MCLAPIAHYVSPLRSSVIAVVTSPLRTRTANENRVEHVFPTALNSNFKRETRGVAHHGKKGVLTHPEYA